MEAFELEKWIWTEADFEQMGWLHCHVYALSLNRENFQIAFDLDYIFKWVEPSIGETYYKFWVAPATLVFENVYEIKLELDETNFELDSVERTDPRRPLNADYIQKDKEWIWTLEAYRGFVSFRSIGYKQFIRNSPILSDSYALDMNLRGGISFERSQVNSCL